MSLSVAFVEHDINTAQHAATGFPAAGWAAVVF